MLTCLNVCSWTVTFLSVMFLSVTSSSTPNCHSHRTAPVTQWTHSCTSHVNIWIYDYMNIWLYACKCRWVTVEVKPPCPPARSVTTWLRTNSVSGVSMKLMAVGAHVRRLRVLLPSPASIPPRLASRRRWTRSGTTAGWNLSPIWKPCLEPTHRRRVVTSHPPTVVYSL